MKKSAALLTEVELELMSILWRLGQGSVHEVMAGLPKGRDLAYTSVSTMLRILEQKRVVKTRKEGRGHVYIPVMSKAEFEARTVSHVVETVFEGTPMALVRQLLGNTTLAADELAEIKLLLARQEKK